MFMKVVTLFFGASAYAVLAFQAANQGAKLLEVSGRVVDASTANGLSHCSVQLVDRSATSRGSRIVSVETDDKGYFVFHQVATGTYSLSAKALGFQGGEFGQDRAGVSGTRLELSRDIFNISLLMWPPGKIRGVVKGDAGDVLSGVTVQALRLEPVAGSSRAVLRSAAKTTDDGSYLIDGLWAGDYVISVPSVVASALSQESFRQLMVNPATMAEFMSLGASPTFTVGPVTASTLGAPRPKSSASSGLTTFERSFWPSGPTPASGSVVRVATGASVSDINFRLRRIVTYRISGRVRGVENSLAGLVLRLLPGSADQFASDDDSQVALTVTGQNGEFSFLGVPSGSYTVSLFSKPRQITSQIPPGATLRGGPGGTFIVGKNGELSPLPASTQPTLWGASPVLVSDSDAVDVELLVRSGFTLSGRIAAVSGQSLSASEAAQVVLSLQRATGPIHGTAPEGIGTVDNAFTLHTTGVPEGRYLIRTTSLPPDWYTERINVNGDVTERPFAMDHDLKDIVVYLSRNPTAIRGRLLNNLGAPAKNASVVIFPSDSQQWKDYGMSPRRLREEIPDSTGSFEMSGIPAGSYLVAGLHAQESQGWQEANSLKKIQSRALSPPAKVNVVAGSVVVVNLSLVDTAQPGSLVGMGRALLRFIALPADRTSKEFSRPLTGGSQ